MDASFEGWMDPLYRCARDHQETGTITGLWYAVREFSFLLGYQDSSLRLEECRRELLERYARARENVLSAGDYHALARAIPDLKQFEQTKAAGYDETFAEALKKKQQFLAAEKKKRRNRYLGWGICLAGVFLLLFCAVVSYVKLVQPDLREKARILEEESDYEGALELYRKLLAGPYAKEADDKIAQMKEQIGMRLIEEGHFEQAVELYQRMKSKEGEQKVRFAWGEFLLARGEYEDAVSQFSKAGAKERKTEAVLAWAESFEKEERYQEAVEVLERFEEEEVQSKTIEETESDAGGEYLSRLSGVRQKLCDTAILTVCGEDADHPVDQELAFEWGCHMHDLDSQIRFCAALDQAGADLGQIFPDGMEVRDVSFAGYQPDFLHQGIQDSDLEQGIRVLVCSRREEDPGSSWFNPGYIGTLNNAGGEEHHYQTWFLPGKWQEISPQRRAGSWEDCTFLILSDTIYRQDQSVKLVIEAEGIKNQGTYPLLNVFDNVTLYAKDQPDHYYLADYQISRPEEFSWRVDPDMGELAKKSGLEIRESNRSGAVVKVRSITGVDWSRFRGNSDPEFLEEALEKGMDLVRQINSSG